MKPKQVLSLLFALLLAPLLRAQSADANAPMLLAQVSKSKAGKSSSLSQHPVVRPRVAVSTNTPSSFPAFPGASTNAASSTNAAKSAYEASKAAAGAVGQNVMSPTHTVAMTNLVAGATNAAGERAEIEYNFPGIPIEQILDQYAKLVGRTILRSSSGSAAVPGNLLVTLKTQSPLTRTEAIMALETILGMNGVTVVPIGDKFAKVVVESVAGQMGGAPSTLEAGQLPDAGRFVTHIVQLKYALAQDIVPALQPFAKMSQSSIIAIPSTQTLILRDYSENVKRMLEMVEKIDVVTPLEIKAEVIPIKYALATDIANALGNLGGGGGAVSVGSGGTSRGGGLRGGMSGGMGGMGGMGGIGGQTGLSNVGGYGQGGFQQGMQGGSTGFGGGSTGLSGGGLGARGNFQSNLQKIIHNAASSGEFQILGQTKIIADERMNSLLVFANEQDMKMIKDIIAKLDVVLAQVLIEAIILEVSLGDNKDVGISYLQRPQKAGSFTGAGGVNNTSGGSSSSGSSGGGTTDTNNTGAATAAATSFLPSQISSLPGGFSYFAKFNNDLDIVLTAVAGDSRINVLSRPRIQTSHNQEADLFVGETTPYVTSTYYGGGFNGGPSSQYQQLNVGITLSVLPLINPDGLVVMQISQNVEQLGTPVNITGVGEIPTTTKRNASSTVAVRDRETIILGGFISNTKSISHSGVPYLKDIPGLGVLFRNSSKKNNRVELIVLLRPTVLPTPEAAAVMANYEKNKLSGVKQAEIDLREDERQRHAVIEAQLKKEAAAKAKKGKSAKLPEDEPEPYPAVRPENPLQPPQSLNLGPVGPLPTTQPSTAAPVQQPGSEQYAPQPAPRNP